MLGILSNCGQQQVHLTIQVTTKNHCKYMLINAFHINLLFEYKQFFNG